MTAPIWMASPPEVHSALLSAGPGPGSLLGGRRRRGPRSAPNTLRRQQNSVGSWGRCKRGHGRDRAPSGMWPHTCRIWRGCSRPASTARGWRLSTRSRRRLTPPLWRRCRHWWSWPTNHVIHGVLVATNFFGINMIPIALNEADYVRMWVQAATTMGHLSGGLGCGAGVGAAHHGGADCAYTRCWRGGSGSRRGPERRAGAGRRLRFVTGQLEHHRPVPGELRKGVARRGRDLELPQHPGTEIQQMVIDFSTNPAAALVTWGPLLFALGYQAFFEPVGWGTWGILLSSPAWLSPLLVTGLSTLGLLGLIRLDAVPDVVPRPAPAPGVADQQAWPAAGVSSTVASPAGSPGDGVCRGCRCWWPRRRRRRSPGVLPTWWALAAIRGRVSGRRWVAAVVSRRRRRPSRRPVRWRAISARHGRGGVGGPRCTTMATNFWIWTPTSDVPDMAPGVTAAGMASDQGAGTLGFAGTARKDTAVRAAGLTMLAGDEFGGGPTMPMVPGTWESGSERPDEPVELGRGGRDG